MPKANEAVKSLVGRLNLEKYKASIKGLMQFGDRLQGTERNRRADDARCGGGTGGRRAEEVIE